MFKLSPVAVALICAPSFAAEPATTEASPSSSTPMEVLTVTGSAFNDYKNGNASGAMRADISLMDTPQSVAVIPEMVIDEQLATTLGEVLNNDSSVTAGSKKWNREQFSLRGFPLSTGSGYLKDGQQVWSHYMHPVEILERVEVLKGPSSMLYGQSAPGGLINMVTKKPTIERFVEVGFDVDNQGSTRYQLDSSGQIAEFANLRGRMVLVKQDETMWREYQNGEENERDRTLGSFQLEGDLAQWGTINVHYDRTEDEAGIDVGGWLDADSNLIGQDDKIWDQSWAFIDIEAENIGADVTLYLHTDWQVKLGYNNQKFERQRFDSAPQYNAYDAATGTYQVKPFDRFDDWELKAAYIDLTGEFTTAGIGHQLLLGANALDYAYEQTRDGGSTSYDVTVGSVIAKPDLNYHSQDPRYSSEYDYYGVYLQDLVTLTDQWKVLVGVRYDELDQDSDNDNDDSDSTLPRFGVIYQPQDNLSVYLNYSESFEPQGQINVTNDRNEGQNLDPVTANAWELGAKAELFDGHLLVTGAYFDITKEDIVLTHNIDDPIYDSETIQDGEQQHKGFELGAQGRAGDNLFISASTMYLDAEYTNHTTLQGKRPIDTPEWSANAWTRYEFTEAFAVNLGVTFEDERFADTANTIHKDSYIRFDAGASYTTEIAGSSVALRFNIENLFDEEYLGGGDYDEVYIGEERNFALDITAAF